MTGGEEGPRATAPVLPSGEGLSTPTGMEGTKVVGPLHRPTP